MKKVVLLCAAGMSTSLLVQKMQAAADEQGFACAIEAHPVAQAAQAGADADIILLGPQVRFQLDRVKEQVSCPVEPIDMRAYGQMNGAAVVAFAKEIIGE